MRAHAHEADEQTQLTAYRHIIQRYLRYVLIRCAGYTNDKAQAQRMAVYALVTACLLFDKLRRPGQLGLLIEMMVKIAGEDPTPELPFDPRGDADTREPVFVLDGRMCEVAGAINGLEQLARELLGGREGQTPFFAGDRMHATPAVIFSDCWHARQRYDDLWLGEINRVEI